MLKILFFWKGVFFLSLNIVTLFTFAAPLYAQSLPHYNIQVHYQADKNLIRGKVDVTFPASHFPRKELLFALPMNRFLNQDPRGPRKILLAPVFALDSFKKLEDDPLFPKGFSPGRIAIRNIKDINGKSLRHLIQDNPDIVVGFSTKQGLLRVLLDNPPPKSTISIEFETQLPNRFQEGVIKEELLTVQWHPLLLNYQNNKWQTDLMEPSPGRYSVEWTSSIRGVLVTTSGAFVSNGKTPIPLPPPERPLKYFPLVFSPNYEDVPMTALSPISSFYLPGSRSRALLLQEWGEEFIDFVQKEYQLTLPWEKVFILQVHGDYEQIRVINNMVLVTTPHYKRTEFLDRRIFGFFSQSLGELWFGESIWNNENDQLWLNRGFGTFFSLKFYAYKFGPDAGIFDFIDWVNPRYREHFIESMARNIRKELQAPIVSPIQDQQNGTETRILLRLVTYKAGLVLSMLEYYVGPESFRKGLHQFLKDYRNKVATDADFQASMKQYTSKDLAYFFEQWFHTSNTLEYKIGNVTETELEDGRYEISIPVERLSQISMPVEVLMITDDDQMFRTRTTGEKRVETVVFITDSPFDEASIDPDEQLLELDRLNNHTSTHFRVRFAFDWKKQREIMILAIPRVGSNAIDGNQVGVETNWSFGKGNSLSLTPGYGTKNKQFLYIASLQRSNFILDNTITSINFSQIGGIRSRNLNWSYNTPRHKEKLSYSFAAEIALETVFETSDEEKDEDAPQESGTADTTDTEQITDTTDTEQTTDTTSTQTTEQTTESCNAKNSGEEPEESGNTNNISISHTGHIGFKNFYFPSWSIRVEQGLCSLGADFDYTLSVIRLSHIFNVGFQQRINWTWIYGTIAGDSPLQKHLQLGSPQVLRGYPQSTNLRDERLLASRLDYEFPLISSPWWGNISSLGIHGSVFYDRGRTWRNDQQYEKTEQRHNFGFGLLWGVDTVALFQFPFKFEIAYPIDTEPYKKPQFILAGVLSFF